MTRRRVNFRESPLEKLHFALLDNRVVIGLIITSLALAGLVIAVELWTERERALPGVQEEGEIVRFGASQDPGAGDTPLVVVRTAEGRLQTLSISRASLLHCHVGDRIRLVRHGAILAATFPACGPPA